MGNFLCISKSELEQFLFGREEGDLFVLGLSDN
jgi:hypothetical protein